MSPSVGEAAVFTSILRALVLAVLAGSLSGLTQTSASAGIDRDCADFATQAAAQAFMLASGPGDPHGLDGTDNDGLACEANPCPCGAPPPPQPLGGTSGGTELGGGSDEEDVLRDVAKVVKVTDGDTLKVRVRGIGIRDVRIIGIDTPEVHGDVECGGRRASRRMRRLAPVGSRVVLLSDPSQDERDRYGRLLRYVQRDGKDVGRAQVNLGQARVYVFDRPFRRTASYRTAERDARRDGRGSWDRCW